MSITGLMELPIANALASNRSTLKVVPVNENVIVEARPGDAIKPKPKANATFHKFVFHDSHLPEFEGPRSANATTLRHRIHVVAFAPHRTSLSFGSIQSTMSSTCRTASSSVSFVITSSEPRMVNTAR